MHVLLTKHKVHLCNHNTISLTTDKKPRYRALVGAIRESKSSPSDRLKECNDIETYVTYNPITSKILHLMSIKYNIE